MENKGTWKEVLFAAVLGVVGAALICMALASCGQAADCDCPEPESYDWYAVVYTDCVDVCEAAQAWNVVCGSRYDMVDDCPGWLWDRLTEPNRCAVAAECYRTMIEAQHCDLDGWPPEGEWYPKVYSSCPVE